MTAPRVDVLVGTGAWTISKRWDVDGTQSDVGDLEYEVVDANGTAVTSGTADKDGTGATTVYSFVLPTIAELTWLRLRWLRDTGAFLRDTVEVVGSQLFTERDARARKVSGSQAPLANPSDYPDDAIASWRMLVTDLFEDHLSRPVVERYCRLELSGNGSYRLPLRGGQRRHSAGGSLAGAGYALNPVRVISATDSGETVDPADIVIIDGALHRTDGPWTPATPTDPLNVVVEYAYGPEAVDYEARENALLTVLNRAVASDISGFAQTLTNPDGTQVFPSDFAFPRNVWEWLKRTSMRIPIA